MAVLIYLKEGVTPQRLLAAIRQEIQAGNISTWQFHPTTGFTHVTPNKQWNTGAYLKPMDWSETSVLRLHYFIEPGKAQGVAPETYGTVNGRFAGMLINHFSSEIAHVEIRDLRR